MKATICVLPGDGIGPEVTSQAVTVLSKIGSKYGHDFVFHEALMGGIAIDQFGEPAPPETIRTCEQSDAILLGAVGGPKWSDPTAPVRPEEGLLRIRKHFDLFANLRPVKAYPALARYTPLRAELLEGVDLLFIRELTGGIYFGKKEINAEGTNALDECVYSREEIERITHLAFQYAERRKKKLTLVDKANVLETSRLWRKVVQDITKEYNEVTVDYMFVDNAAMQIILNPKQFDVILTENMFGDIISDEASVISGSLGLLPSASIGNGVALFEPIHG